MAPTSVIIYEMLFCFLTTLIVIMANIKAAFTICLAVF